MAKFGSNLEVVASIDQTLSIYKSDLGYFWMERQLGLWSDRFFNSANDALNDLVKE